MQRVFTTVLFYRTSHTQQVCPPTYSYMERTITYFQAEPLFDLCTNSFPPLWKTALRIQDQLQISALQITKSLLDLTACTADSTGHAELDIKSNTHFGIDGNETSGILS